MFIKGGCPLHFRREFFPAFIAVATFIGHGARAVTLTWNGGAAPDTNWSNPANFGGTAPAGNAIVFNATGVAAAGTVTNTVDQSVSVTGLTYGYDSSNWQTTSVAVGQTLTVNGNVVVGLNTANTTTNAAVIGAGTLAVTNVGGTFQVGAFTGSTSSTKGNSATLNLSGLSNFTLNLGTTGTLTVGSNDGQSIGLGNYSTLKLASNSTITANTISVGAGGGQVDSSTGAINVMRFSADGVSTIYANTIAVGAANRATGTLNFAGDGNGSVLLRAADTVSRAAMNIGVSTSTTGSDGYNTVDFTSHVSDLLLGTLAITDESRAGDLNNSFWFDTGTLDVTTLLMGRKRGSGTGAFTTAVNLSGGTIKIGTGGVTLLNRDTSNTGSNESSLNITGSAKVTVNGNIVQAGTGTQVHNGIFNLDGGTVDMTNHNIGGSGNAAVDTLIFASGTLKNVAQINNGGGLTKSTAGVLTLAGTDAYTGTTNASEGTLLVDGALTNSPVLVANGATLGGTGGSVTNAVTVSGKLSPGAAVSGIGTLSMGSLSLDASSTLEMEFNIVNSHSILSDQVNVANLSLTSGAALTLNILGAANTQLDIGQQITLIHYTGTWNNSPFTYQGSLLADGATLFVGGNPTPFLINYGSHFVTLTAVPEPGPLSTFALIAIGAILFLRRDRSRPPEKGRTQTSRTSQ